MTQYYVSKSEAREEGFKCTACGATWSVQETKSGVCPTCGYACNAYVCNRVPTEGKE
jgi:rubrerythrin